MNSRSDAPAGGGGGVTRIVRQWASDSVRHTPTDGGGVALCITLDSTDETYQKTFPLPVALLPLLHP